MVRLPAAIPARQEFLGLQPLREPAESRGPESAGIFDHRLLRWSAYGGFSAGRTGILLESGRSAKQFTAWSGSGAADAGLRPYFAAAIEDSDSVGLFPQPRRRPGIVYHGWRDYLAIRRELQLHDECVSRRRGL